VNTGIIALIATFALIFLGTFLLSAVNCYLLLKHLDKKCECKEEIEEKGGSIAITKRQMRAYRPTKDENQKMLGLQDDPFEEDEE